MGEYGCSEDQLVEQPAIQLFSEMGWQTACAGDEVFEASSSRLTDISAVKADINMIVPVRINAAWRTRC